MTLAYTLTTAGAALRTTGANERLIWPALVGTSCATATPPKASAMSVIGMRSGLDDTSGPLAGSVRSPSYSADLSGAMMTRADVGPLSRRPSTAAAHGSVKGSGAPGGLRVKTQ